MFNSTRTHIFKNFRERERQRERKRGRGRMRERGEWRGERKLT